MDGSNFTSQLTERSDPFDRIRAHRAKAMQDFREVKTRMRNTNSWDHYDHLAQYARIHANEHAAYCRILWRNGEK